MDVIALTGSSNTGKTQTLNILYALMLHAGYSQVTGCYQDHSNNDFIDVLEMNGIKIGIATQGDYSRQLPKYLAYLDSLGCTKTVCACTNTKPGTINAVRAYTHNMVNKTTAPMISQQRIINHNDASLLLSMI